MNLLDAAADQTETGGPAPSRRPSAASCDSSLPKARPQSGALRSPRPITEVTPCDLGQIAK